MTQSRGALDRELACILLGLDVTAVLDKYKCTHWLSDDTLLGAVRDKDFVAGGRDINLGIWANDFDVQVVHELLKKFDCKILRLQGKPDDGMVITVGRGDVCLNMIFYYPYRRKSGRKQKIATMYSSRYVLTDMRDALVE